MKKDSGKTRYILLGLMAKAPQTGYSIKKSIEYEFRHFWQESFGQIYPTLKSLVAQGLAQSVEVLTEQNGRKTVVYEITEAGRGELHRWLAETPTVEKLRYEILLKVSLGSSTDMDIIDRHLEAFIKRNEAEIREMEEFLEVFKKMGKEHEGVLGSQLTALCGKYFYAAMKDWALEAREIIADRKEKK